MAKGVRSGRRGAGLETFGDGALVFFHKASRDLHTFKEFGLDHPRHGLGRDPLRLAAASVLADLVLRHGGDADSGPLFDELGSALDDLDTAEPDEVVARVLRGAWGIISVLGYQPELSTCPMCGTALAEDEVGSFRFRSGCRSVHPVCRRLPGPANRAGRAAAARRALPGATSGVGSPSRPPSASERLHHLPPFRRAGARHVPDFRGPASAGEVLRNAVDHPGYGWSHRPR